MTDPVIAVIDRDPTFLDSINETLARSGYIAILGRGDDETHHMIRRERPALIIIDGSIDAGSDKSASIGSIIAEATALGVPVLITVDSRQETAWPGSHAPGTQALLKPIDPGDLQSKISQALGQVAVIAE